MAPPLISYIGLGIFSLEMIINGLLFFQLVKKWRQNKLTVVAVLCGMYLLYLGFVSVEFFFFILNIADPIGFYFQEGNFLVFLFPFFGGISAGFFLLFIDYFENEKVSPIHSAIYGAFFGTFILNMIYNLIIPDMFTENLLIAQSNSQNIHSLILMILQLLFSTNFPAPYFVMYIVIVTMRSLIRIKSQIQEKAQKKQVVLMQLTIIFYYLITMLLIIIAYRIEFIFEPNTLIFVKHLAPHLSVFIGGILMYFAYVKAPIGFLQFQRIEKIMVINRLGLLLFSYDFELPEELGSERDILLSGGIFAVLNLFSEMIKTKNIHMIHFQDRKIMLSHNDNFIVFLVVDRITSFLWSAIESFSGMFNLKYGFEARELSVVPKSLFDEAEILLKLAFGRQ